MSRYSEAHTRMSAVITHAVRLAFPDSRAKRLASALGCSLITGKRIASTGRAHPRWELVAVLRQELAKNRQAIEELDAALRSIEHEKIVPAGGARAAASLGPVPSAADRPGDRAEQLALISE